MLFIFGKTKRDIASFCGSTSGNFFAIVLPQSTFVNK